MADRRHHPPCGRQRCKRRPRNEADCSRGPWHLITEPERSAGVIKSKGCRRRQVAVARWSCGGQDRRSAAEPGLDTEQRSEGEEGNARPVTDAQRKRSSWRKACLPTETEHLIPCRR